MNLTCDRWHVTHDTWHIMWDEQSLKISAPQLFRFWDWQCLENIWTKGWVSHLVNQSMDRGDCRTALAKPGLLTNLLHSLQAQTLPDAALPMGKIHPFIKIAVTNNAILMPFKI